MKHVNYKGTPKLSDCVSFLYIEMAKIEQGEFGVVIFTKGKEFRVPITTFACLLLGPGTSISHAAMKTIADSGCIVIWVRRNGEGMYTAGNGRTSSNKNLIMQAKCFADHRTHTKIARNMYAIRYPDAKLKTLSIKEMMGLEGRAMQAAYKEASEKFGVEWEGRDHSGEFESQTAVNQALSIANNLLYDICHAGLLVLGFSPDLGFIHTGNAESFVFDIADLYKERVSIPCAFEAAMKAPKDLDRVVRRLMHKYISEAEFMKRFPKDIAAVFEGTGMESYIPNEFCLWTPEEFVKASHNYGGSEETETDSN